MDAQDPEIERDTYISGPRWAGLREFLVDVAARTGVRLKNVNADKGLIGETIYFTVCGKTSAMWRFKRLIAASIEAHNR